MKAVIYSGKNQMSVKEVDDPKINKPTDAILRVTTTAICGSDLHMYEGRTGLPVGHTVGHEIMGVIEKVGEAVEQVKPGDRVVLPFNISCGTCFNCSRGFYNACLYLNPQNAGAAYGYASMGPYQGGQAEYVLVPHADVNCLKLPGQPFDQFEDDFVLLADIFPTGFHATELAKVGVGMPVAIFGAGPVGLLAAHSAMLKGASEVYVVDFFEDRLNIAKEFGAIPININDGDPVEQIFKMRKANQLLQATMRPGESAKMPGVMAGIDAVGYQARDDQDYAKENQTQVLENLMKVVNSTGSIGLIGVFMPEDPGAGDQQAKKGIFPFPVGQLFEKGLSLGSGQAIVKKYNRQLLDLIIAGKAKPSKIISKRISIDQAPEAYQLFDQREKGYSKVVIKMGS